MRNQQPKDSYLDEVDEHDLPTEPMFPVIPAPYSPSVPDNSFSPIPQQGWQGVGPAFGPTSGLAGASAYPQLPPVPVVGGGGRPAGGVEPVATAGTQTPPVRSTPGRSPWPILLGLFFVAVQLLLLVRFVLKLISWPASTVWVGNVYSVSDVFVWPLLLLWKNVASSVPLPASLELYTLLAVLTYWLLSRLLVRLFKAILRSR